MAYKDDFPISRLELSARAETVCRNAGWKTLGDLRKQKLTDFMRVPNCGHVGASELLDIVRRAGQPPASEEDEKVTDALRALNDVLADRPDLIVDIYDNRVRLFREIR